MLYNLVTCSIVKSLATETILWYVMPSSLVPTYQTTRRHVPDGYDLTTLLFYLLLFMSELGLFKIGDVM
jgi:hypothetical protein